MRCAPRDRELEIHFGLCAVRSGQAGGATDWTQMGEDWPACLIVVVGGWYWCMYDYTTTTTNYSRACILW